MRVRQTKHAISSNYKTRANNKTLGQSDYFTRNADLTSRVGNLTLKATNLPKEQTLRSDRQLNANNEPLVQMTISLE